MDTIDLPLLGPHESIAMALRRMKAADARAVVVAQTGEGHRLYSNLELVQARVGGKVSLRDLHDHGTTLVQIRDAPDGYERALDLAGALYGVVPAGGASIRVVTRHERLAALILNAGKVCLCSKNPSHQADSPPAQDGQKCVYGDGYYECY